MKNTTIVIAAMSALVAGGVLAHAGASGIVKQRMDAMDDMGDKSKAVADMFKGKSEFDKSALAEAAETFVEHGSGMVDLFSDTEESRTGSETEALPVIWEEWDEFTRLAEKFVARSESLQKTIASTDNQRKLKKAFFRTTKSCSNCHKRFRKPQE